MNISYSVTRLRMQNYNYETKPSNLGRCLLLSLLLVGGGGAMGSADASSSTTVGLSPICPSCPPGHLLPVLMVGAHRGCTWLLSTILQENLGQASLECRKHPRIPCIAQGSFWEEDHTHTGLGDFSQPLRLSYGHCE